MGDELGILKVVHEELQVIKATLAAPVERQQVKEYYDVEEFARLIGKAPFTVREYCRNGRLHGEKRNSGRGKYQAWVIRHEELLRYQKEGLIPLARICTRIA